MAWQTFFHILLSLIYRRSGNRFCVIADSIFYSEIGRLITGKRLIILPVIAGMILFLVHTDYQFFLFNSLGLLIPLFLFYITLKYLKFLKGFISLLLVPLVYFAAGGFIWIFIMLYTLLLCTGSENKKWIRLLLFLSFSFLLFYISEEFMFFQTTKTLPYISVLQNLISELIIQSFLFFAEFYRCYPCY